MKRLKSHTVDLILESSSALFLCGAAFAVVSLFVKGERSPISLVVATSLPAAASLLLLVIALLVPSIYAVGRMAFPLNITLPVIHSSIVFMLAQLTRGSFGVEKPPSQLDGAMSWANIGFLVICLVFQILLLTALTGFRSGAATPHSGSDAQR